MMNKILASKGTILMPWIPIMLTIGSVRKKSGINFVSQNALSAIKIWDNSVMLHAFLSISNKYPKV